MGLDGLFAWKTTRAAAVEWLVNSLALILWNCVFDSALRVLLGFAQVWFLFILKFDRQLMGLASVSAIFGGSSHVEGARDEILSLI